MHAPYDASTNINMNSKDLLKTLESGCNMCSPHDTDNYICRDVPVEAVIFSSKCRMEWLLMIFLQCRIHQIHK